LLIALFLRKKDEGNGLLERKVDELEKFLMRIENALREDFRNNREELGTALEKNSKSQMEKIEALISKIEEKNKENKESIEKAFKGFQENFDRNVESFNNLQREKFGQLADKQKELVESTEKQLEKINNTVDEKLQKTLNERLSQSFELVGKQLESVQTGLGEMRTIATDVGGLKKVLSNVKLRGNVGEVQLAMLLEQILAPTQYEANVKTKEGSADPVEFAIKLWVVLIDILEYLVRCVKGVLTDRNTSGVKPVAPADDFLECGCHGERPVRHLLAFQDRLDAVCQQLLQVYTRRIDLSV
jgi:DNA recombination protein RmuC